VLGGFETLMTTVQTVCWSINCINQFFWKIKNFKLRFLYLF